MKLSRLAGTTSQTVYLFIQDSSSSTGAGLTGLVFNSAGLTAYYVRTRGTATAITLATLAAANSAFSSGGFKEVDATNMPGVYRLDIPDAALAASADSVAILLKGATNMAPIALEIELTGWNNQDAVRGGLTALPNAAAEAAGGLYTRGSGAGQINQPANGLIDANVTRFGGTAGTFASGRPEVNATHIAGAAVATGTAQLGVNVVNFGGVAGTFASGRPEVNTTHAAGTAWGSGAITAASIAADAITAAKVADGTIDAATFAAGAIDAAAIAAGAITSSEAPALANLDQSISTILTTSMTEAYRGADATGSVAKLLYEILAHLGEHSISGTTKTLKKLDGVTTAKTYTLNSSTTPTAITETT